MERPFSSQIKINFWDCAHNSGYYEKLYSLAFKFHRVVQKQIFRRGGRIHSALFCSLSENVTTKDLLKSVYICQSHH